MESEDDKKNLETPVTEEEMNQNGSEKPSGFRWRKVLVTIFTTVAIATATYLLAGSLNILPDIIWPPRFYCLSNDQNLTILLVRHGEKIPVTEELSQEGINRAVALTEVIEKVSSVYTAAYACRVIDTALPLAVKLDLPINVKLLDDHINGEDCAIGLKNRILKGWKTEYDTNEWPLDWPESIKVGDFTKFVDKIGSFKSFEYSNIVSDFAAELANQVLAENSPSFLFPGRTVLIVSHSSPGSHPISKALGADEDRCQIDSSRYDNLCIISNIHYSFLCERNAEVIKARYPQKW